MLSSGGPGSAPPFTFPDLGPVSQSAQLLGPMGHPIDTSAPTSEASAVPTPASASASGVPRRPQASDAVSAPSASLSGTAGSAGAAPSPTPASAGARGVASSLQAAPQFASDQASVVRAGEVSASSAAASALPTSALQSASGASSNPGSTQLIPRSSPDSSPLREASSNAAHFCRTGDPLPAVPHEASRPAQLPSAQWFAVEDIVHAEVSSAVGDLRAMTERRFTDLAHLMIGLVRHPPLRVDYELDQRLERARSLGEVVQALNPDPCSPPMGWDEEMRQLQLDVKYHENRARHFESLLNKETDLKNQAQILCHRASFERNELFEVVKSLRHERDEVSRQLRKSNSAMATNDETIALLKSQCERYEASLKASDSLLAKDRELFKSGLVEYNRNMRQLRALLVDQARGQPETQDLVRRMDENILPRAFEAFLGVLDSSAASSAEAPASRSRETSAHSGTVRRRAGASDGAQDDVSMDHDGSDDASGPEASDSRPTKRPKNAHPPSAETSPPARVRVSSRTCAPAKRATRLGRPSVNLQERARAKSKSRPSPPPVAVARQGESQASVAESTAAPASRPPSPTPSEASTALFSDASEAEVEFETSDRDEELEEKRPVESSPLDASVVVPPRRDGRPVRPASTTSALRSMVDVERENAPDDAVIGDTETSRASEASASASATTPRSQAAPRRPRRRNSRTQVVATLSAASTAEMSSFARTSTPPAPVRGEQPLVRVSRKLPDTATPFLDPPFRAYGAKPCWCIIQNVRMPTPIASDVMVECSAEGIEAWADWENPNHPFQRFLASMPAEPCLFDVDAFMPDVPISIRADVRSLLVKLWRQFTGRSVGRTEKNDLGFSLFERGHWISTTAVERWLQALAQALGEDSSEYQSILAEWNKYNRERNNRADRLRLQIPKRWWQWCFPDFAGHVSCETETILEPSVLQYSFENLVWAPQSDDWVSECLELDGHQPWRNCWVDVPSEHPYNTTFAPCNPAVPLFVPRGMTTREVASAITVNPVLDPRRVTAPWVREFTSFHGPPTSLQGDVQQEDGDEVSEEEEVEEVIEEIESSEEEPSISGNAGDDQAPAGEGTPTHDAQVAAADTQPSAPERAPTSEASVEKASAGEVSPEEPSSPPSVADQAAPQGEPSPAARLRVLAKVASSSDS